MPINIVISDRVKTWFHRAVVTAAGAAVIAVLSWFVTTHIQILIEQHGLTSQVTEIDESNAAQWKIIAEEQATTKDLDTRISVIERIQLELILPHINRNWQGQNNNVPPLPPANPIIEEIFIPESVERIEEIKQPERVEISPREAREIEKEEIHKQRAR